MVRRAANGRLSSAMSFTSLSELASSRRLVVKIGSALLVKQGEPNAHWLETLAQDLSKLRLQGVEIIVTSMLLHCVKTVLCFFPCWLLQQFQDTRCLQ